MLSLSPRPRSARERPRGMLDVSLDPAQSEAVQRPPGGAMLVLGEAGYGKTTVALRRLARLHDAAGAGFRAAVLVPSEGLAQTLQPELIRLGVDVNVKTYDRWARGLARRIFGDIPRRESAATAVAVARLKRDPALLPLLRERARLPPGVIDDDLDAPRPRTHAHAHRGDLQHLFGDRLRMERLARESLQGLGAHAVEAVLEHTRIQFSQRTEQAFAHVSADRLAAVDGRSLDEGTDTENSASIDVEDYAVLFELDRLRAEHRGKRPSPLRPYDCLVLDEAQEFSPLELSLIGRCLRPGGTLIVAGDADQQVDHAACFRGWESTLRDLGAPSYERVQLAVGYRCAPGTMALARAVRDAAEPERGAPLPPLRGFGNEAELIAWIAEEAAALGERDPAATVCVATRRPPLARRVAAGLRGVAPCRLVLDGRFVRHRGVAVSTVDQLKGLEFDFVIVPDATLDDYPDDAPSRRALYVALTRARHQAALAHAGPASPLVAAALGRLAPAQPRSA